MIARADPHVGAHVFVYGTLRSGFIDNEATLAFRTGARFVSDGWAAGAMYSTGWYPALVEGREGRVHGEIWQIEAPGLMDALDDYEGLSGPDPREYDRVRRRIATPRGAVEAWVYVFLRPVDESRRILSGDWADASRP